MSVATKRAWISANIVLHWSIIFYYICLVTYEWTLEGQAGGDGESRVQAAEDGSQQHEFTDADVHGQTGQMPAQWSKRLLICQGTQSTQALFSRLQAAFCGWLNQLGENRVQRTLRKHIQHLNPEREEQKRGQV